MPYIFLLLLLLPLSLRAQREGPDRMPAVAQRLDTLHKWLHRPGLADTCRVKLLIDCSIVHMDTRIDSARWYSEQAVALARRLGFDWGLIFGLNNLAATYYYASDYPAAQRTFEQALAAARREQRPDLIGHAYLGLGNVAAELYDAGAAQAYYAQAQRAYAANKPRFVYGELLVLHNRANGYLEARQPALARPLLQQGLALLRRHPTEGSEAKLLLLLGTLQKLEQHPDSAVATWQTAARLARRHHESEAEGTAWLHLASLHRDRHHYPRALAHAQRAAALFRRLGDPGTLAEALDVEAAALAALHHPGAYDTLRRYTTLRDTILSQQRLEAVATAQARFDRAGQQARIQALSQQRRISQLRAAQLANAPGSMAWQRAVCCCCCCCWLAACWWGCCCARGGASRPPKRRCGRRTAPSSR